MRLPPLRSALCLSLALALPLFAAPYSSTSPQELQRRLEQDTNRLVDSLRNQRNSPSRSSGGASGPDPWTQQLRARRAEQEEQARMDAEWYRDHPNETRQQYFARVEKEAADQARELREARRAAVRARENAAAEKRAAIARQQQAEWNSVRTRAGGYVARSQPPLFDTPAQSLGWLLTHDNSTGGNTWAANQAAMLLLEGWGAPQDLPRVVRLLDPRHPRAAESAAQHPQTRTLFTYLQLAHPQSFANTGITADPAAARAELEKIAATQDFAKWYLARVLANSADPTEQKKSLQLVVAGYRSMRNEFALFLHPSSPTGRAVVIAQIQQIFDTIIEQHETLFPDMLANLPIPDFDYLGNALPVKSKALHDRTLQLYVNAIAERVVPASPLNEFNYPGYDRVLIDAAEIGSDTPYGLALLEKNHLISFEQHLVFIPAWLGYTQPARSLRALTDWAARNDSLGARARLALAKFAEGFANDRADPLPELPEAIAWRAARHAYNLAYNGPAGTGNTAAAEKATHQAALAAFARREASAPTFADLQVRILPLLEIAAKWSRDLAEIDRPMNSTAIEGPLYAVTSHTFDLDKAQALFDRISRPEPTAGADDNFVLARLNRHQALLEATRLGDAFAPRLLAQELGRRSLSAVALKKLRELSDARRARDETARRPRALAARLMEQRFKGDDALEPALAEALAAGSTFAARLQLNHRIETAMAREADRPPSWKLDPALIAEFDAGVAAWDEPASAPEWDLLRLLNEQGAINTVSWFESVSAWMIDREQRLVDAEFIHAIQPEMDAVIATLSAWPGINQQDPRHTDWINQAAQNRSSAEDLIATDGLGALKLFLKAASYGERSSLEMLADHIRHGSGELPRSTALADQLVATAFKMTQADAEVGDSSAAESIANAYFRGNGVAKDPAAGLAWLRYAAELGELSAVTALRDQTADNIPKNPADARHWAAVAEALLNLEYLPTPPRRIAGEVTAIAPLQSKLEAALSKTTDRAAKISRLTEAEEESLSARYNEALDQLKKSPDEGLTSLAKAAGDGSREACFAVAQILGGGRYGIEPDPTLAQRFYAVALKQLERVAEFGDLEAAYRLGLYVLELPLTQADPAAALRWLTYAAELGNSTAAETLARLYTDGAPGIPADPTAAARWTAFGETTMGENFKPRAPLRK